MQRFTLFCMVALSILMSSATWGQAQKKITHEEEVVRTTYAKLSYADEIRIMLDSINAQPGPKVDEGYADKAINSRLNFQLSNFKVGDIKEVAGRITSEVSGLPMDGEVLEVAPSTFNYRDDDNTGEYVLYAKIRWRESTHQSGIADSWPFGDVVNLAEMGGPYQRYATYAVTVTFGNKSRTYNTIALFGINAGTVNQQFSDPKEKVHFMDLVSGNPMLDLLARTTIFPSVFVKTKMGKAPFVHKWLLQQSQQSCDVSHKRKGDVCCNADTGMCSIGPEEVPRSSPGLLAPISYRQSPHFVQARFNLGSLPSFPVPVLAAAQSTDCSQFNFTPGASLINHGKSDTAGHSSGLHDFGSSIPSSCTYTNGAAGLCNVSCSADAGSGMREFGSLTGVVPSCHTTAVANKSGSAGSAGGGASCQGTTAGTVVSCFVCGCNVGLSIEATADGLGAKINFPQSSVWNDEFAFKLDCPGRGTGGGGGGPGCTPNPNSSTIPLSQGPVGTLLTKTQDPGDVPPPCTISPIIIDTEGEGLQLTSYDDGVTFDMQGNGHPFKLSWTKAGSHSAFLALDRDGSGTITSGKELFGDWTAQPRSPNPNGFLALAEFDKPENGGNGDGVIDAHDAVYSKLRLWIDINHDGVAQRNEVYRLDELGVYSLALNYRESNRQDQFGNQYRYKARVNPNHHDRRDETEVGRWTYDVFFVTR